VHRNVLHGLNPPVNITIPELIEGEIDRIQYPRPRTDKKRKREDIKNGNKSPKLKFSRTNENEKLQQVGDKDEDTTSSKNHNIEQDNNMNINNLMNNTGE